MLRFEDKILTKNLQVCERFSARRLLKEFSNTNFILVKKIGFQLT